MQIIDTYKQDIEAANKYRDTFIKRFYKFFSLDGEFVCLDGEHPLTLLLQFRQADAVATSQKTKLPVYIEEKYDSHQPNNFCIETESNTTTTPTKDGWIKTAKSDHLLYTFLWLKDMADVFFVDFPSFREWFMRTLDEGPDWRDHTVSDSPNHSHSWMVPIKQASGHVRMTRYLITLQGSIIPIPVLASLSEIRETLEKHGLSIEINDRRDDA